LTLDFKVPGANPKQGDGQVRHALAFPSSFDPQRLRFITEKVMYHGSEWLEIDQIEVNGCQELPTKIFGSSLKDGRMNDMAWTLALDWDRPSTIFVVKNPRDREGHFKLSMFGKYLFDAVGY